MFIGNLRGIQKQIQSSQLNIRQAVLITRIVIQKFKFNGLTTQNEPKGMEMTIEKLMHSERH